MLIEKERLLIPGRNERQPVLEAASYSLETRRIPDTYPFTIKLGKLFTPDGQLAENSIEKDSDVGKREYEAFLIIQDWASQNNGGLSIWISPPHKDKYPCSKIILSEVIQPNNSRLLVNKAILIDLDENECIGLFNNITGNTIKLTNPEELRSNPILFEYINQKKMDSILDQILESEIQQLAMIKRGYDVYEAERTIQYFRNQRFAFGSFLPNAAKPDGMIGSHTSSCPPGHSGNMTAFEFFSNPSKLKEGIIILCCTCPFCNKKVEAEISDGRIHCPKCKESAPWFE